MRGKIFSVLVVLGMIVGATLFLYGVATGDRIGSLSIPLIVYGMICLFRHLHRLERETDESAREVWRRFPR